MSLRARLLAVVVSLTAIGLIVAGAVTYTQLRSFLVERVDRTVTGNATRSDDRSRSAATSTPVTSTVSGHRFPAYTSA